MTSSWDGAQETRKIIILEKRSILDCLTRQICSAKFSRICTHYWMEMYRMLNMCQTREQQFRDNCKTFASIEETNTLSTTWNVLNCLPMFTRCTFEYDQVGVRLSFPHSLLRWSWMGETSVSLGISHVCFDFLSLEIGPSTDAKFFIHI